MDVGESIIVMNSKTWEAFKSNALETASLQDDPIEYIKKFNSIEVVIDEKLEDNFSEVWSKEVYESYKRGLSE
jgi:hypothetical protein